MMHSRVSEAEWGARTTLAACYRLMLRLGMADLVYNHITAKVPGEDEHILINAYGLHYSEVTASNLYKIDLDGRVVLKPEIPAGDHGVNAGGLTIHTAVHGARPEVGCVLHTHTRAGMAVAAMDCGLLNLCQNSMMFHGALSYHDYGAPSRPEEGAAMVRSLGRNNAMVLRNHGLLTSGRTVPEAFLLMYWLEQACKVQVDAMQCGTKLRTIDEDLAGTMAARFRFSGEMEWAAMLRLLDREDPTYKN